MKISFGKIKKFVSTKGENCGLIFPVQIIYKKDGRYNIRFFFHTF